MIELIAVVVVLALAASVAAVSFGRRNTTLDAERAAHALAERLRNARNSAMRRAAEEVVLVDVARKLIVNARATNQPIRIGDGVAIEAVSSRSEQASAATFGIRFFPNGASTGGTIKLSEETRSYEVRVNWLTGRVSIDTR